MSQIFQGFQIPLPPKELLLHPDGTITMQDGSCPKAFLSRWAKEYHKESQPMHINICRHQHLHSVIEEANDYRLIQGAMES